MKKILFGLFLGLGLTAGIVYAAGSIFSSQQIGSSASPGYVLQTNGANPGVSTWVATSTLGISGSASPLTTKGDLYTFDTSNQRLGVGADGLVLTASSTSATGLAWQTASSTGGSGITSLNGLVASTQTFATGSDTNIGLNIVSSGSTHTFTPTFTGTLAVSRGGTGTSTWQTGSIPFYNGTILTENNQNFFWDNTNKRLGIGTSTPKTSLHVSSSTTPYIALTNTVINASTTYNSIYFSAADVPYGTIGLDIGAYKNDFSTTTPYLRANSVFTSFGLGSLAAVPSNETACGTGCLTGSYSTVVIGDHAAAATPHLQEVTIVGSDALQQVSGVVNQTVAIGGFVADSVASVTRSTLLGNDVESGASSADLTRVTAAGNLACMGCVGSENTGIGFGAFQGIDAYSGTYSISQSTGSFNTALGHLAGSGLFHGDRNIYVGTGAGSFMSSSTNTIIIGPDANLPTTTLSNAMSIGNLIYGTNLTDRNPSNLIGSAYRGYSGTSTPGVNSFLVSAGRIGIGSSTPTAKLTVVPSATEATIPALYIGSSTQASMLQVNSNGYVGINTPFGPNNQLQILSVQDPMTAIGTNSNWPVTIGNTNITNSSSTGIGFFVSPATTVALGAGIGFQRTGASSAGDLFFDTLPVGGALTEQMRIASNGSTTFTSLAVANCDVLANSTGQLYCGINGTGGGGSGVPSTSPFTNGYIPYATTTLALTNSPLFVSGTKIGLGTTTPLGDLHIYNSTGNATSGPSIYLTNPNMTSSSSPTSTMNAVISVQGAHGFTVTDVSSGVVSNPSELFATSTPLLTITGENSATYGSAPNDVVIGYQAGLSFDTSILQSPTFGVVLIGAGAGEHLIATTTDIGHSSYGTTLIGSQTGQGATALGEVTAIGSRALLFAQDGATSDTVVGFDAGLACTTCVANVIMGNDTLAGITTGFGNTAIGTSAMSGNTSGDRNVALGRSAGSLVGSGNFNTFLGQEAHAQNALISAVTTQQDYNVDIGYRAGQLATSSNETIVGSLAGWGGTAANISPCSTGNAAGCGTRANNSMFGYQSGKLLKTGNNNVLFGYQTGYSLFSGSNNLLLGYNVDIASTTSNYLSIGNLIFGNSLTAFTDTSTQISAGVVGIGTSTPIAKFTVVASSTDSAIPELIIASSSGVTNLQVAASGKTSLNSLLLQNVASGNQCLHADSSGNVTGTGSDCGSGGGGGGTSVGWASTTNAIYTNFGYKVGINSSTPNANLTIQGSSTAPTLDLVDIATSTNDILLSVNYKGQLLAKKDPVNVQYSFIGSPTIGMSTIDGAGLALQSSTVTLNLSGGSVNSGGPFQSISFQGPALPDYSWVNNPKTGMYNDTGTDVIKFANNGVLSMLLDTNGRMGINTSTPIAMLSITGTTTTDTLAVASSSGASQFIIKSTGRVGINSTTPTALLTLQGYSGGTVDLMRIATSTGVIRLDVSSNGLVGIGTSTGAALLTIQGLSGQTNDLFDIASSSGAILESYNAANITSYSLGTSTTAQLALFYGQGSTASTTLPLFTLASSSGASLLQIDSFGHRITGGGSPTCGTGCASVQGDDNNMRVVTGTTVTSVTVNFYHSWSNSPICIANEESTGTTVAEASSTPSTVVLDIASALTTKNIAVHCEGSVNITN